MKHNSSIQGINLNLYDEVLDSQYNRESTVITGDAGFTQSNFFEPILFFIGIAYNPLKFHEAIAITEQYLSNAQPHLSDLERGIYYHVRGFLFSKKGPNHYHMVFESLNKSLEYLHASGDPAAQYYQARVSDTYAQVLQNLGFYSDALALFQESLKIKMAFNDDQSVALTHGNLGRLNFGIGNFNRAVKHFKLDLKILDKSAGAEGLKSKMMMISSRFRF